MSGPAPDPSSSLLASFLARCTFPVAGAAVQCAVSGGPDSMALLVLAGAAGLQVTAVHVDHGVRPGSANEADLVRAAAERFGASFDARTVVVVDGPNFEARARQARYDVLAADVLTGHTLDDQAETVLMFLMRGAGPQGVAGIDAARRPLLSLRRSETRRLCDELGIEVVDDPSNADPRFTRNRVRHELLPLLDDIAARDVAPLLARTATLQRDLLEVISDLAATLDPTDARALTAAPAAVASEALRAWWRRETALPYAPDAAALERMLAVVRGDVASTDVVAGWRLARTSQRLRLDRPLGDATEPR